MCGMSEKVWLISGNDETTVMPDMTPSVAIRSRDIWMRLVLVFAMAV